MMQFPTSCERIAASALLLLSTPSNDSQFSEEDDNDDEVSMINLKRKGVCSEESLISKSVSCSSSLTIDDDYSEYDRKHQLKIIAVVSRSHDMTFKVVRKTRSKHHRSSNHLKIISSKVTPTMSDWRSNITTVTDTSKYQRSSDHRKITSSKVTPIMSDWRSSITTTSETSSCLSSGSSARSRYITGVHRDEVFKRRSIGSPHIQRRAEAILRFLANGCASEMRIRQVLGDSPDTSKALRMLLGLAEIYRSGVGGRTDPFIYMIAN